MHYGIQDFVSIDDLLKKVGKVNRVFGKGGMVNTAAVRTTILTDWYQGKLNHIFWNDILIILHKIFCLSDSNQHRKFHGSAFHQISTAFPSLSNLVRYLYWVKIMELTGIIEFYYTLLTGISELNRYKSGLPVIWQYRYSSGFGSGIYILDSG